MRRICRMVWITALVISLSILSPSVYVNAADTYQDNSAETIVVMSSDQSASDQNTKTNSDERDNFDIASLLSLLGVGLLKFIDDKLKIKLKDKFETYKKYLVVTTVGFVGLEVAIIICYFCKLGAPSFGNLKNLFLGLIPVVFCILTLITEKNEGNPIILSQSDLEKRINDFTSCGMAPLGMLVGDMDFFGKVYNKSESRRRNIKDDITYNSQIKAIVDNNIDRIEIVCKIPTTNESKRRIGYLLEEFEGQFHIRFFDETIFPIPQMRGRIMYRQNQQVVVITKKIRKPSKYEYSEYAASSLPGGLFADLWRTVWHCSAERVDILEQCRAAYTAHIGKKKEKV